MKTSASVASSLDKEARRLNPGWETRNISRNALTAGFHSTLLADRQAKASRSSERSLTLRPGYELWVRRASSDPAGRMVQKKWRPREESTLAGILLRSPKQRCSRRPGVSGSSLLTVDEAWRKSGIRSNELFIKPE